MRSREFIIEVGLVPKELNKYNGRYLKNLINLIKAEKPLQVSAKGQGQYGKFVLINPSEADRLLAKYFDGDVLKVVFPAGEELAIANSDDLIKVSTLEKSGDIKGKEANFNIGDIGEIALGISAAGRFDQFGLIDFDSFVNFAQKFQMGVVLGKKGQIVSSKKLTYSGLLNYRTGKQDQLEAVILGPGRSVDAFVNFISSGRIPPDVRNVIEAAIVYVNEVNKIEDGMERIYRDPNKNVVEVICDGVSDQKGTKADLKMLVDGTTINVLSAKTGKSQLGQASGHDWNKQKALFNLVFGIPIEDLNALGQDWGVTNSDHLAVLSKVYSQYVIPKVQRLTGSDSVQNEKILIKGLVDGLIRYSNNYDDEKQQIETVDIVKLIVEPGSPGYKLLRIDSRLTDALMNVDLYGKATPNNQGIEIFGKLNGVDYSLFKIRSYESKAGNVIRTILEGGPLLDELAQVGPRVPAQPAVAPSPTKVVNTATNVQSKVGEPMGQELQAQNLRTY